MLFLQDRIYYIHYGYRTVREVRPCVHGTPLRLRGRAGVFRRREGHLLAAHLGPSLRRRLVLRFASFTRRFLIPRFAACGPSSGVVRSPFFTAYLFLVALVLPVCGLLLLWPSYSACPHSCVRVPRSPCVPGRSDVFPDRGRVHGEVHFSVFHPFSCLRVRGSRVIAH